MRKVYQNEKSVAGLAMAIMAAVGVTGVLFGILPFTHIIAHPSRSLRRWSRKRRLRRPRPRSRRKPLPNRSSRMRRNKFFRARISKL